MEDLKQQISSENRRIQDDVAEATAGAHMLSIKKEASYNCIICALGFDDPSAYNTHLKSDEHETMALVTGIGFNEPDPANTNEFPPFYYCVLCGVFRFDYNSYENHLKDKLHRDMTKFMRMTSFCSETTVVGVGYERKEPLSVQDFEEVRHCPSDYCLLCGERYKESQSLEDHKKGLRHTNRALARETCEYCNITYVGDEIFKRHLNSDLHIRIRDFKRKMLLDPEEGIAKPESKNAAEANPRLRLYFCDLCSIEFNDADSFNKHKNISTHRRIQILNRRLKLEKRKSDPLAGMFVLGPCPMFSPDKADQPAPSIHYCELCKVWCSHDTITFEIHALSDLHRLTHSVHNVQNWNFAPE